MVYRRIIAAFAVALAIVSGCTGYHLEPGEPDVDLSATSLDFGQVERGFWREKSLAVQNRGNATLHVSDYALQDGSSDSFFFEDPARDILPGMYAELAVRYTPTHEGGDAGAIRLLTDDPDEPELTVFLSGLGVIPRCEVEPTLLYFPTAEGSQTLPFGIRSVGSGALTVASAALEDGAAEFTVAFPAGYEPPFQLDPGLAVEVLVTYTAAGDEGRQDRVLVTTSDPELPAGVTAVELVAAGEPPDGENQPPIVEIVAPPEGSLFQEGAELTLVGQVADLEEAPEALGILWHSTLDGYLSSVPADADGEVILTLDSLAPGQHVVTLKAFDGEGAEGQDTVELTIYADGDELEYTISGGATPYHYFHVDDDMAIRLNGQLVFLDNDGSQDHHPPLSLFANPGDTLRVLASDQQYCTKAIDGLVLHVGSQHQQPLNDSVCASACEDHDDYDPGYGGPWPNTFLDETYSIQIP